MGFVSHDIMQHFIPIVFLVVVCFQLNFFHGDFMKLTNIAPLLDPLDLVDASPTVETCDQKQMGTQFTCC